MSMTGSLVLCTTGYVDLCVAGRESIRLWILSPIVPGAAKSSRALKFDIKQILFFRYTFRLSVVYVLSVIRLILILANLNRGFPEFRSTIFRTFFDS